MGQSSKIEWTNTTWNPLVGCRSCSSGCAKCYAEVMSNRLKGMAKKDLQSGKNPGRKSHYLNVIGENGKWNNQVELVPEALADPLKWKRPRKVFVNSMSDLFYGNDADLRSCGARGIKFTPVPFEYVDKVFAVMALCPQHIFQVLTKRPDRMAKYFELPDRHNQIELAAESIKAGDPSFGGKHLLPAIPFKNVHLGTSVENQAAADERIPYLFKCPAAIRFLSAEPLLGGIGLARHLPHVHGIRADRFWVIVGGESGLGARPCDVDWIRSIVSQCKAAGVACFAKQLGANVRDMGTTSADHFDESECWPKGTKIDKSDSHHVLLDDSKGGSPDEWPIDLRVREFPQLQKVAQ
jgi:protein gp37